MTSIVYKTNAYKYSMDTYALKEGRQLDAQSME